MNIYASVSGWLHIPVINFNNRLCFNCDDEPGPGLALTSIILCCELPNYGDASVWNEPLSSKANVIPTFAFQNQMQISSIYCDCD